MRPPRANRLRVLYEYEGVGDAALISIVSQLLSGNVELANEVARVITQPSERVANVAERLLTGRIAEEYFLDSCRSLVDIDVNDILDFRQRACGFDFGVESRPNIAIEVKGIKATSGNILFTDREWREATDRGTNYWLVLVGQLDGAMYDAPAAKVIPHPTEVFTGAAQCDLVVSKSVQWRMNASI